MVAKRITSEFGYCEKFRRKHRQGVSGRRNRTCDGFRAKLPLLVFNVGLSQIRKPNFLRRKLSLDSQGHIPKSMTLMRTSLLSVPYLKRLRRLPYRCLTRKYGIFVQTLTCHNARRNGKISKHFTGLLTNSCKMDPDKKNIKKCDSSSYKSTTSGTCQLSHSSGTDVVCSGQNKHVSRSHEYHDLTHHLRNVCEQGTKFSPLHLKYQEEIYSTGSLMELFHSLEEVGSNSPLSASKTMQETADNVKQSTVLSNTVPSSASAVVINKAHCQYREISHSPTIDDSNSLSCTPSSPSSSPSPLCSGPHSYVCLLPKNYENSEDATLQHSQCHKRERSRSLPNIMLNYNIFKHEGSQPAYNTNDEDSILVHESPLPMKIDQHISEVYHQDLSKALPAHQHIPSWHSRYIGGKRVLNNSYCFESGRERRFYRASHMKHTHEMVKKMTGMDKFSENYTRDKHDGLVDCHVGRDSDKILITRSLCSDTSPIRKQRDYHHHLRQESGSICSTSNIRPHEDMDSEFEKTHEKDGCFLCPRKRRRTSQDIICQILSLDLSSSENEMDQIIMEPQAVPGETVQVQESEKKGAHSTEIQSISPISSHSRDGVADAETQADLYTVTSPEDIRCEVNKDTADSDLCGCCCNSISTYNDNQQCRFRESDGQMQMQQYDFLKSMLPRILLHQGRVFWSQEIALAWKKDCRKWLWKNRKLSK